MTWQCNTWRQSRIPARLTHTSVGAKQQRETSRADGWDRSDEPWAPSPSWFSTARKDERYLSCWSGTWHHPSEEQIQQSALDTHRHPKTPQPNPICHHNAAGAGCALPVPAARVNVQPPSSTSKALLLFSRSCTSISRIPVRFFVPLFPPSSFSGCTAFQAVTSWSLCVVKRGGKAFTRITTCLQQAHWPPAEILKVTALLRLSSVWNWWCKRSDPEDTSDTQHPHCNWKLGVPPLPWHTEASNYTKIKDPSTLTDQILFLSLADRETQHDQNSGIGLFWLASIWATFHLPYNPCLCVSVFPFWQTLSLWLSSEIWVNKVNKIVGFV